MAATWFYVDDENKRVGPLTLDALGELVEDGEVLATTSVYGGDMGAWAHARTVPGLRQLFEPAAGARPLQGADPGAVAASVDAAPADAAAPAQAVAPAAAVWSYLEKDGAAAGPVAPDAFVSLHAAGCAPRAAAEGIAFRVLASVWAFAYANGARDRGICILRTGGRMGT